MILVILFSANLRAVLPLESSPNVLPAGLAADVNGNLYVGAYGGRDEN